MPETLTEFYDLVKPEIDGSADTWGERLNEDLDKIDFALRNCLQSKSHPAFATPLTANASEVPIYIPPQDPTLPPAELGGGHKAATQQYVDARVLFYLNKFFPPGSIMLWSGAFGSVPAGWTFCDGSTVGGVLTPDLRGRFVLCANNAEPVINPWANGGSPTAFPGEHTHAKAYDIFPGPAGDVGPFPVNNGGALYSGTQATLPYIAQMYIYKYAYW